MAVLREDQSCSAQYGMTVLREDQSCSAQYGMTVLREDQSCSAQYGMTVLREDQSCSAQYGMTVLREDQSCSAQYGMTVLREDQSCSALSLCSPPTVALETVAVVVWLNRDRHRPQRMKQHPLPLSSPLSLGSLCCDLWSEGPSSLSALLSCCLFQTGAARSKVHHTCDTG